MVAALSWEGTAWRLTRSWDDMFFGVVFGAAFFFFDKE
jgi:hypothetical protein